MTHPTIKAVASRIGVINASEDYDWISEAKSAARVILAAEPTEAEIEAVVRELHDITDSGDEVPSWGKRQYRIAAHAVLRAANVAKAREMGL